MSQTDEYFRSLWKERGLNTEAASASAACPPPKGYDRLYHLLSAEHALSNVMFKRLKVALISELNDPFEVSALHQKKERVQRLVLDHKEKIAKTHGLLCFSEDWIDPVLWTHYGVQHRGICLGFDIKENTAIPVSYEDKRLAERLEEGVTEIDADLSKLLMKTKFKSWSYEKERRIIVPLTVTVTEGSLKFYSLNGTVRLAEVILGVECSLPVQKIREVVQGIYPNVAVYQARLAGGFFGIVPNEETVVQMHC
jgi:Protein of unknown function (DUF2971)